MCFTCVMIHLLSLCTLHLITFCNITNNWFLEELKVWFVYMHVCFLAVFFFHFFAGSLWHFSARNVAWNNQQDCALTRRGPTLRNFALQSYRSKTPSGTFKSQPGGFFFFFFSKLQMWVTQSFVKLSLEVIWVRNYANFLSFVPYSSWWEKDALFIIYLFNWAGQTLRWPVGATFSVHQPGLAAWYSALTWQPCIFVSAEELYTFPKCTYLNLNTEGFLFIQMTDITLTVQVVVLCCRLSMASPSHMSHIVSSVLEMR